MTAATVARVAISNPFIWPYVRRGAERLLHDLSHFLVEQGKEVEVFAMAPADQRYVDEGITYQLTRERRAPQIRQLNSCHLFAFDLQQQLRDSRADVIHCLNYFDAYAAVRARRRYGLECQIVFHAVGIPTARYFRAVPLDWWFMRTVLQESDAILGLSRFACDKLAEDFGCHAVLMPPPVSSCTEEVLAQNGSGAEDAPVLLFVGDVSEPRKGAELLCKAFSDLRREYPQARLKLSGHVTASVIEKLLADEEVSPHREAIEFLGVGEVGDLPTLYRTSTVTVLPSVWEAFGLVVVESLAAGTPVVGTDHAGIPDILDGNEVGRLFDPGSFDLATSNRSGLVTALLEAIELARDSRTEAACMRRAADYSWDKLGPEYLALYQRLGSAGVAGQ